MNRSLLPAPPRSKASDQKLFWQRLALPCAGLGLGTALVLAPTSASAQFITGFPNPTDNNAQFSAGAGQLDLGSNFLQRLGREATYGYAQRANPGGGGAPQADLGPAYRAWFEGYGTSARTDLQGTFVGDRRKTGGGVAGVGMTVAPGFSLGISVDQSRTDIDVPLALQSAKLDLTQLGINGAYTTGPWTMAFAAVHGFARIGSQRGTVGGPALANYRGRVDGALGELSYYYGLDQSRIVPKLGLEYVVSQTDSYREAGGVNPVNVGDVHGERARVLVGAEVGHYWIVGRQIIDVSAYGKFVDNFSQSLGPVQVSLGGNSISVQGVLESRTGADAGAGVSWILSNTARLYANYDGKYRSNFTSHQGTLGVEVKW